MSYQRLKNRFLSVSMAVGVCAIITILLIAGRGFVSSIDAQESQAEADSQDYHTILQCEPDRCPAARVRNIIDGDTLESSRGRIRIYGIDTPEHGERCYSESTNRLKELAGISVLMEGGNRATDPYGRSLFYLYTSSGDSIDEILTREGLARAWTGDGQYMQHLIEIESMARKSGEGCLWERF